MTANIFYSSLPYDPLFSLYFRSILIVLQKGRAGFYKENHPGRQEGPPTGVDGPLQLLSLRASFPSDLAGLIMEQGAGGDVDLVAVVEGEPLDAVALVDDAVDAVGILDDPGVVLIAQMCMPA